MMATSCFKPTFALIMIAMAVIVTSCAPLLPGARVSYPVNGWKEKKPERLGMDGEIIDSMLEDIDQSGLSIDGLVVVHKGVIVAEKYYHVYKEQTLHETYSVTKSVISTLIGIALQQGCIESIEDSVLGYFPDMIFLDEDGQKDTLTIKDFLTMSSGLAYDPDEMYASPDWVQYTLDQPLIYPPGSTWFYSNGGPQVLSALISNACEMDTIDFADQYLFEPLGISNYQWERGLNGHPNGSWGLELTPRDMAKIGYLYLHDGVWDGEQILPPDWVTLSTTRLYHRVPNPLEPWYLYYGFLWWIHVDGFYAAHGYKGQFIYIAPEYDLVVVFTGNITDQQFVIPQKMIREYLIPALAD